MIGTVYRITSTVNGQSYIGATHRPVEARWCEHRSELERKAHHNHKILNHYKEYGDVFTYHVIESVEANEQELLDLEAKYIIQYDSVENGFNLSYGWKGCTGYINEEHRVIPPNDAQFIKNLTHFKILEYKKIAKLYNVDVNTIISIAKGRSYKELKINFDSYEDYEWHQWVARKYRFEQYGDRVKWLYEHFKSNPEIITLSRAERKVLTPEGLKNSLLKDDYEYEEMIKYILHRNNTNKKIVEQRKSEECLLILNELVKDNNCRRVAKKLGMSEKKVGSTKNGAQYSKFHQELREKVKNLPRKR